MKKLTPIISFFILSSLTLPIFANAQVLPKLIVCDGPNCHFNDLMTFVRNAIDALVIIATFITVLALVYMGFTLIASGGNPSALKEVKSRALKIIIGYIWILAAWLIVYTIMKVLVDDVYIKLLGKPK